jgi:hypothetical protein
VQCVAGREIDDVRTLLVLDSQTCEVVARGGGGTMTEAKLVSGAIERAGEH